MAEVTWKTTGKIPEGPSMDASGKIFVDSYNMISINVPSKGKATARLPESDGIVSLILIKTTDDKLYPYLSYELEFSDGKSGEKQFGGNPLMLLGGAIELVKLPKRVTIWYSPDTPAPTLPDCKTPQIPDAPVSILIGSSLSSSAKKD
jgi:hypothetical protein